MLNNSKQIITNKNYILTKYYSHIKIIIEIKNTIQYASKDLNDLMDFMFVSLTF